MTFTTGGNLQITIPAGSYLEGEKYCIVIAQAIPGAATINAPVYITIGTGTTLHQMQNNDGVQLTASAIRTRTRYATIVVTTPTGGYFRALGHVCQANNNLTEINS